MHIASPSDTRTHTSSNLIRPISIRMCVRVRNSAHMARRWCALRWSVSLSLCVSDLFRYQIISIHRIRLLLPGPPLCCRCSRVGRDLRPSHPRDPGDDAATLKIIMKCRVRQIRIGESELGSDVMVLRLQGHLVVKMYQIILLWHVFDL